MEHLAWARCRYATLYCAVVDQDEYSTRTACRGAWENGDTVEVHDAPAVELRCGGCVTAIVAGKLDRGVDDYAAVFEVTE